MSPLTCAAVAQSVERIHGKDEVSGSIPDRGSIFVVQSRGLFPRILIMFVNLA